jgi:hypothetical protein
MASLLEWRVRILLLAEFQKGQRWIFHPFGAVIENKQTLPAGWKFIDDSHRSRGRQIAETLVEEGSILRSLSAVSESPVSRQVVDRGGLGGALQIQRLEGSRRSREPMDFVCG